MRKISVREFKNYCDEASPRHFIFADDNQDWHSVNNTLRIKLEFDKLKISFNPNTICLSSSNGTVSFERVKHIKELEQSLLGRAFGVVCGNISNNNEDRTYVVVVR